MTEIVYNDIHAPITTEELSNIPEEMRTEKRWICWGSDKVPVSVKAASNGKHFGVNVTDPANWGTFAQASAAIGKPAFVKYADDNFHIVGVGFVVGDGWFCADLDGGAAHNKENVPEQPIKDAIMQMHTYIETSLSGCGYHIFGKCDFDTSKAENNKPHRGQDGEPVPESYEVEFFTRRKFIAITGRIVKGADDHINASSEGISGSRRFYERWILEDWTKDNEKRAAERAKKLCAVQVDKTDADAWFLLNYREILAASDSSNFKRGGPGVKLAPGEYSWIAAIKAMQEIGVPEADIMDWCRRGSNFRSEKDVRKVLDKAGKPGTSTVAGIVADAKAHGWQPDPDKLTGEYKAKHEERLQREAEGKRLEQEYHEAHREEYIAALAAIGIDCAGDPFRYSWKRNFDGVFTEVMEKETGEIVYKAPVAAADPEQPVPGATVHTVPGAKYPEKKIALTVSGFDDVEIKPTDYLFFPWFPRGKLVAVQGDSSSSKSTFMYAVGAKVSTGEDLLGTLCEDPGNVMFITIEDDASDIKIAFLDSGGDISHLRRIADREQITKLDLSPEGAAAINAIIKQENIKLLVLDPLQQFLSGDMNKANETRPQLGRLMNIAAENNICIAFLEHMGKDTSKAALHRGVGSVDIGAATRSIIQIVTDPEDDFLKIAFTVKNNTADFHDTQRAIHYQVKDHPGNKINPETKKRERYHGHAEFIDIIPEYNERLYKKAVRKADDAAEEEILLAFEYEKDPLVLTVREIIAENPQGVFIGTDDIIQRITQVCGRCPYDQTKSKITGIYARIDKLRSLMIDNDGIQVDKQSNSIYPKAYNWHGELTEPAHTRTKGFTITPVTAAQQGSQQTKI